MVLCREKYAKDLDKTVFPGLQGGPLMHIIAAKAVCFREAAEPSFADYQKQIVANARRLSSALVAGGFRLVSGGTDNHLMLVDVFSRGLTGKAAEAALGKAGITVNKNAIPFDPNPPMTASGVRIGTPAVTTRGMGEREVDTIGELITRALSTPNDDAALGMAKAEVEKLCRMFPLYAACATASPRSSPTRDRSPRRCRRSRVVLTSATWRMRCRVRWTIAACFSSKRALVPVRRSRISSRQSSAASAFSCPQALRTFKSRS